MNKIEDLLTKRRTISISNICETLDYSVEDALPLLKKLEESKKIRVVNSPCTLDCSSCSTCGDEQQSKYSDTTIIVSLLGMQI